MRVIVLFGPALFRLQSEENCARRLKVKSCAPGRDRSNVIAIYEERVPVPPSLGTSWVCVDQRVVLKKVNVLSNIVRIRRAAPAATPQGKMLLLIITPPAAAPADAPCVDVLLCYDSGEGEEDVTVDE